MTILTTARLTLRPRVPHDAEPLFATMADTDVMRWWSRPPVTSVAELRDYFTESPATRQSWAVAHGDRVIGFVTAAEKRVDVTEIGYLFASDVWGSGLAREAAAAVIAHLFAAGQRRIFADTDPDNAGSIRLLERLGFKLEGRLRAEWHTHIGVRDTLLYGLLKDEWRAPG